MENNESDDKKIGGVGCLSRDAFMLRYYMGFRVIGWLWIIVVLAFAVYRFFVSASLPTILYEVVTGSGAMVNMAIVALLALGIVVEWYGSFKLFTLRRKIRSREEAQASEART